MLKFWRLRNAALLLCFASLCCCVSAPALGEVVTAQGPTVAPAAATCVLSGTVFDPSGAKIPRAMVHVQSDQVARDIVADGAGRFNVLLPAGNYDVTVSAVGFDPVVISVVLTTGVTLPSVEARLSIATQAQEVTVGSDGTASTAASDNKSALVFKTDELKNFSNDDAVFDKQIAALASDDGSPNIYVDGFSGGRFPPKSSIREIRINQNPYSAQYEELGNSRIEIFTKPGSDDLHGYLDVSGNDNAFNTTDPYLHEAQPPYHALGVVGELTGPINKKTSLALSTYYNNQQNNAAVHASTLDANNQPITLTEAVPDPTVSATYSARIDRQVTPNNTLTARYEYNQLQQTNGGVGLLVLPEAGTNSTTQTQTLQISDTQVIGAKSISEAHFQYLRTRLEQDAVSGAPSINVEGAFTGGGATSQKASDNQDRYELQEIFTRQQGAHFLRFGGRLRVLRDANLSTANYNGAFTFPSLTAYQITKQVTAANPTLDAAALDKLIRTTCVTTDTGNVCGGATQFNLTTGEPSAVVLTSDLGAFAEDEWKVAKNVTVDLGLRFETQSAIPDHFDPAPRVGFAWAVGQKEKSGPVVTVRGGGGIFYDRFDSGNILTAIREQTGLLQPSFYVSNPAFYPIVPSSADLSGVLPTLYNISPRLRSQETIAESVSVERSLWKKGTITVDYTHRRGVHLSDSVNLNAPLPGTYVPADPTTGTAASGVYPLGSTQAVYQFQSGGYSDVNRVVTHLNLQPTKKLNLFAAYIVRRPETDTSGATSFPSNSYDIGADKGRSNYNPPQRLFSGGFWQLPLGFSANAFLSAGSSLPFDITTGTDLNGDTQYNDRPAFATDLSRASVVQTRYGNFDRSPLPGARIIPKNYGDGPAFVDLELGAGKSFKFGPRPAEPAPPAGTPAPKGPVERPDPRYAVSFSFDAENVLNHVNAGPPVGVLTSPYFGQSISLASPFGNNAAANRIVTLHTTFSF